MIARGSIPTNDITEGHSVTPARSKRLSNFHKSYVSPTHGNATPATARRLSNFHRVNHTPSAQRTPLRPYNGQTPAKTPRRQSFAAVNVRSAARSPIQKEHPDRKTHQPQLSKAEIAQMYSSTIKLCQDNKINARNTWTLNLIDYMSMLVKGEEHTENTARVVSFQEDLDAIPAQSAASAGDTNFQLAGVTLDAGVKIYCSRVDSVHNNAFKVLGGLSRTGSHNVSDVNGGDEGNEEHDENDENTRTRRQKSAKRTGRATLEPNLANLTSQKLETDLAVDPLFHKMSAAFDEGGARGMLLNNLLVGGDGQILFDSGEPADDYLLPTSPGESQEDSNSISHATYDLSDLLPAEDEIDRIGLCTRFLKFFDAKRRLLRIGEHLDGDDEDMTSSVTRTSVDHDHDSSERTMNDSGFEFDYDSTDLQNAGELGVFSESQYGQDAMCEQADDDEVRMYQNDGNDFSGPAARRMSLALQAQAGGLDLVEAGLTFQNESSYAFFDVSSLSGWAGPRHWRFRAMDALAGTTENYLSKAASRKTKRPRGKTAMLLDFFSEAPSVDFANEFEPGKTATSHELSKAVREALSEKKVTLPEDLHYTTRALTSLFIKPEIFVRANGIHWGTAGDQRHANEGEGWYDFDNDCDNENFCPADEADTYPDEDGASDGSKSGNAYGMELIDEPTRVERIAIDYAKVAKKVDVGQLKSGLWTSLCGEGPTVSSTAGKNAEESDPNKTANAKDGDEDANGKDSERTDIRDGSSRRLQTIVSEMPTFVPETSLADVSLPYVFICLLHLANEKTLKITQAESGSLTDLIISSEEPGNE